MKKNNADRFIIAYSNGKDDGHCVDVFKNDQG
jgi:hypothetical protein